MTDSILDDPRVQRLIKIQDAVRAACPGEDVEIVDADVVYVNFAHRVAVCITPDEDSRDAVDVVVTEWDPSGGVHAEQALASYLLEEYAPLIAKAFLDEQYRRWQEIEDDFDSAMGIEPRKDS